MSADKDKTVLVTGGAGYIGSVLVRQLLAEGYQVRVLDVLRFGGEPLVDLLSNPAFTFQLGDVRDTVLVRELIKGCGAVVHLAAIVGDPACKREPELARSVNVDASLQLFAIASEARVSKFVFASTCSNYGKMSDPNAYVDETSELRPVSLYAETKVEVEQHLLNSSNGDTQPTCLRFSTVYGLSPRIRFDLTVNEFTREMVLGRELVVFGEQFWRPYCHVVDLARSVILVLNSDRRTVSNEVFNVGDTAENYTKKMIVDEIRKRLPDAKVRYVFRNEDPRDYRVKFSKIRDALRFTITKRVPDGIRETIRALRSGLVSNPDDKKFSNI